MSFLVPESLAEPKAQDEPLKQSERLLATDGIALFASTGNLHHQLSEGSSMRIEVFQRGELTLAKATPQ